MYRLRLREKKKKEEEGRRRREHRHVEIHRCQPPTEQSLPSGPLPQAPHPDTRLRHQPEVSSAARDLTNSATTRSSPASKKQQQESPHNLIRDKSNEFLRPVLLQADYMFPSDEIETEKQGVCPSNNCNVKPFDASFAPRHPGCPYDHVNFDYTLISPSPLLPINPTTNDVSQQLSANAELHHQQGERTEEVQTGRRQSGRCCPLPLSEPPTSRGHW